MTVSFVQLKVKVTFSTLIQSRTVVSASGSLGHISLTHKVESLHNLYHSADYY